MLVQAEFNTVCEILYEVKAKVIIEALGKRKAKVETRNLAKDYLKWKPRHDQRKVC